MYISQSFVVEKDKESNSINDMYYLADGGE